MKRGLKLGFGIPLIVIGFLVTIAGAAMMIVIGPDGRFTTPSLRATSAQHAIVFDAIRINGDLPRQGPFSATFSVDVTGSDDVFVGVGPATEVQGYLNGVGLDEVTEVRWPGATISTRSVPGGQPPENPGDADVWTESDQGTGTRSIEWTAETGNWVLVVMNADGSAGVDITGTATVEMGFLGGLSIIVLVVGLVMLVLGLFLTISGARTPRTANAGTSPPMPGQTEGAAPPPPPGTT